MTSVSQPLSQFPAPQPLNQQPAWQDQAGDINIRHQLTQQIISIFAKKRGQQMQNWGQRLNDFVRRLEEHLYVKAPSKEEYVDLNTLESRLQQVARQLGHGAGGARQKQPGAAQASHSQPGAAALQANGPLANPQPALPPGMVPLPGPGAPAAGPQQPRMPGGMSEQDKTQYVQKQQRWLLFLRHCAKCRRSETECELQAQCKFGKWLWQHILHCEAPNCDYPRCSISKNLLKHHQKCQSASCPICAPVKEYVRKTRMQQEYVRKTRMQQQQQHQASTARMGCCAGGGLPPSLATK